MFCSFSSAVEGAVDVDAHQLVELFGRIFDSWVVVPASDRLGDSKPIKLETYTMPAAVLAY